MWVFIERDGDSVLPVSLELCSETRKLCEASGEKLVAVIVGSISDGELQRVLDCGVDKVIHVTGTGYDYFNNDAYTNLFTVLCRKYRPTAVMVGGTMWILEIKKVLFAKVMKNCTDYYWKDKYLMNGKYVQEDMISPAGILHCPKHSDS